MNRYLLCIHRKGAWLFLIMMFVFPGWVHANKLLGFEQIVSEIDGRSEKRLYKLEGKTFDLKYDQAGDFELSMEPAGVFRVEKTGLNTFTVTIINPKSLWKKHKSEPFKVKWIVQEIVAYE